MTPTYLPTPEVVQEYLRYLEETAHEPSWNRFDSSIHLLLGLRDPEVDQRLIQIAPKICVENSSLTDIHSRDLIRLASDPSVGRVVRLVTRHFGEVSLAWFSPTQSELLELVSRLGASLVHQNEPRRKLPAILASLRHVVGRRGNIDEPVTWYRTQVVFASLCDLAHRFGNAESLALVRQLSPTTWLERTSWQRICDEQVETASLTKNVSPQWLPELPPALIRDPLTRL
jgi:hypothetical protein